MATYFVKNGGNNALSGLSDALAWETLAKVNSPGVTFNPGDSILFKKGSTWTETLTLPYGGSTGGNITYGSYGTGAAPIITGSDTRDNCIYFDSKDYITIDGINCVHSVLSGIMGNNSDHVIVRNCTVTDCAGSGIRVQNCVYPIVEYCTVTRVGDLNIEGDTTEMLGIFYPSVSYGIMRHNTVSYTSRACLLVVGGSDTHDNLFEYNEVSYSGQCTNHSYGLEIYGQHVQSVNNTTVRYNYFHNCTHSAISFQSRLDGVYMYGNIFVGSNGIGGDYVANITGNMDAGDYVHNLVVYNNVLYQSSYFPNIRIPTPSLWDGAIFKNNIFYTAEGVTYECDVIHSSPPVFDYNCHYAPDRTNIFMIEGVDKSWATRPAGFETHGINADPLLTDVATANFYPTDDSPCLYAGISVGAMNDYAGTAFQDPPSIGAYEVPTMPAVNYLLYKLINRGIIFGGGIMDYIIDQVVTFYLQLVSPSTNSDADADATPTYRLYEASTTAPILTGSFVALDTSNTNGLYSIDITMSAANGFEVSKSYIIRKNAIVGGLQQSSLERFQIISSAVTVGTNGIVATSIASGAITSNKFAAGAITAAAIADAAIDIATFAADCLTSGALKANVESFTANAITTAAINNDAITAAKIAAGAIDFATFAADCKTGTGLKANVESVTNDAITAAAIAAAAIDFATFAADCKTGTGLKANVESISAGAVTATAIATNAVDADALATDAVTEIVNAVVANASLAALIADWVNGGRLDLLIDAIKAKTDSLTFTVAGNVDANVKKFIDVTPPAGPFPA